MSWIDEYSKGLQGQTFQPSQNFQPSGYAGGRPFYLNPTYSQSPMQAAGLTGLADEFTPANMLAGGGDLTGYTASLTGGSNRNYITNPETGQTGYVQARFGPNGEYIGSEFIPAQSPSGLSDVRTLGPLVVGAAIPGMNALFPAAGAAAGTAAAAAPIVESTPSWVAPEAAAALPAFADPTMVSPDQLPTATAPITTSQPSYVAPGVTPTVPGVTPPGAANWFQNAYPWLAGGNALLSTIAADRAAEAQQRGIESSNQLLREIYQSQVEREKPFYQAGVDALGKIQRGEFQASPDYAFRLGEGLKQLDRMQSRAGTRLSGRGMKEGQRFASDLASGEFGDWFNRQATLAGYGPASSARTGQYSAQYGAGAGGNQLLSGDVAASRYGGMAGAGQNLLASLADYYGMKR